MDNIKKRSDDIKKKKDMKLETIKNTKIGKYVSLFIEHLSENPGVVSNKEEIIQLWDSLEEKMTIKPKKEKKTKKYPSQYNIFFKKRYAELKPSLQIFGVISKTISMEWKEEKKKLHFQKAQDTNRVDEKKKKSSNNCKDVTKEKKKKGQDKNNDEKKKQSSTVLFPPQPPEQHEHVLEQDNNTNDNMIMDSFDTSFLTSSPKIKLSGNRIVENEKECFTSQEIMSVEKDKTTSKNSKITKKNRDGESFHRFSDNKKNTKRTRYATGEKKQKKENGILSSHAQFQEDNQKKKSMIDKEVNHLLQNDITLSSSTYQNNVQPTENDQNDENDYTSYKEELYAIQEKEEKTNNHMHDENDIYDIYDNDKNMNNEPETCIKIKKTKGKRKKDDDNNTSDENISKIEKEYNKTNDEIINNLLTRQPQNETTFMRKKHEQNDDRDAFHDTTIHNSHSSINDINPILANDNHDPFKIPIMNDDEQMDCSKNNADDMKNKEKEKEEEDDDDDDDDDDEARERRLKLVFPTMRTRKERQKLREERIRREEEMKEPECKSEIEKKEWEKKRKMLTEKWKPIYPTSWETYGSFSYGHLQSLIRNLLEDYGRHDNLQNWKREELLDMLFKVKEYEKEEQEMLAKGYMISPLMNEPVYKKYCLYEHKELIGIMKEKFPNVPLVHQYSKNEILEFLTKNEFYTIPEDINKIPVKVHYMYYRFKKLKIEKLCELLDKYVRSQYQPPDVNWKELSHDKLLEIAVRHAHLINEEV